jgi:hypothetical protein
MKILELMVNPAKSWGSLNRAVSNTMRELGVTNYAGLVPSEWPALCACCCSAAARWKQAAGAACTAQHSTAGAVR